MAIRHKDIINYKNSYIGCEISFGSYFTCFRNKYFKENRCLCVLILLCSGNIIELYFESCPWFIYNCPWFMPNPCEQGAILKCNLPLIPGSLFQGLILVFHFRYVCSILKAPHDNLSKKKKKKKLGAMHYGKCCISSLSEFVNQDLFFVSYLR